MPRRQSSSRRPARPTSSDPAQSQDEPRSQVRPLPPGLEPRAVVVLGGGAPNGAMMAGTLAAIYSGGKTFNTIYTSGAGALIGMLYAAPNLPPLPPQRPNEPKPAEPTIQALRQTLEFGVSDEIYQWLPLGYKTFFKSGPWTKGWIEASRAFKLSETAPYGAFDGMRRLYNDLVDLCAAATCPTDLNPSSQGLCGSFPFSSDIIDFDALNNTPELQLFLNAHHIETARMEKFGPGEINADHFDASLSYPFIYAPKAIEDDNGVVNHYFEGGCVDPLNLESLAEDIEAGRIETRTVVIIDVLGSIEPALVRLPDNLWDAFGISIMLPVVSLARMSQTIFDMRMKMWNNSHPASEQIETIKLTFDIPPSETPHVTDWSASNMTQCWRIGYETGLRLMQDPNAADRLPKRREGSPVPQSYDGGSATRNSSGAKKPARGASAKR